MCVWGGGGGGRYFKSQRLLPLFSIRILLISLPFSCLNSSNAFVLLGGVLKNITDENESIIVKTG